MYLSAPTLDDLLKRVYEKLIVRKSLIYPTKGAAIEMPGVLLEIRDPRARLSRTEKRGTIFSCLGELMWYLAGTNNLEFIKYYIRRYEESSDDGLTVYGAYGPRLFNYNGINQIQNVIEMLSKKPESRQAVIQLFHAEDLLEKHKDIPCTCTLQFMIRNHKLNLITYMRSNDAFLGLPHDIFAFTMLQEIIARTLGVELGKYKHSVGSLHLYLDNLEGAKQYIQEGWQTKISMPPMPLGDPWSSINALLDTESLMRNGKDVDIHSLSLDPYWKDLARLLLVLKHHKENKKREIIYLKAQMSSQIYHTYITRKQVVTNPESIPQESLRFEMDVAINPI